MVRDRETGKSKGFCFLKYDDQRSTVLAVDNFNGATLLGRTLRVDHSREYRQKTKRKRRRGDGESESEEESEVELDEEGKPRVKGFNVAPKGWLDPPVEETSASEDDDIAQGIDLDDPMRDYLIEKRKEEKGKTLGKKKIKQENDQERKHKHRHRSNKDGEERRPHRHRHHHRHGSRRHIEDGNRDVEDDSTSGYRPVDDTPRKSLSEDHVTHERSRPDRDETPDRSHRTRVDTPEYRPK